MAMTKQRQNKKNAKQMINICTYSNIQVREKLFRK
jgi:hypothetical protein